MSTREEKSCGVSGAEGKELKRRSAAQSECLANGTRFFSARSV